MPEIDPDKSESVRSEVSPPSVGLPRPKWKSQPVIPLFGCLLGLLLIGCASFLATEPSNDSGAEASVSATPTSVPAATVDVGSDVGSEELSKTSLGDSLAPDSSAPGEPVIGKITFALDVADGYQPISPGFLFTEGITQVHAIFRYSGMSPDYTWERVWYLNDREVSRRSGPWTGPERGTFHYFVDIGGQPLPPGNWILEIYVEEKLRSLGVFVIEDLTP